MPPIQLFVGAERQPTFDQSLNQIGKFIELNQQDLARSVLMGMFDPSSNYFIGNIATVRDGVNRSVGLMQLSSSEVLQPMNSREFNPKGGLKLSGSVLNPEMFKIDELFNYIEIWTEFGTRLNLMKNQQIPNEENPLEYHDVFLDELMKRAHADMRRIIITGVKGSGTDAVKILDGLVAIAKKAVTANKLTPFSINPTSTTDILSKIDDLVAKINPSQRWNPGLGLYVALAPDMYALMRKLALEKSSKFAEISQENLNNGSASLKYFTVPSFSHIPIFEEPHLPAGAMYCTTKSNLIVGVDTQSFNLRSTPADREIKVLGDGMLSVGVREFNPVNGMEAERMFACNDAFVA